MRFTDTQVAELQKPLDTRHVAERRQSGRVLNYIEGWHAIAEANRIFGFDAWNRETLELREVRPPELVASGNGKETWRVGFICRVRVTVGDVVREGTGYGSGALPDLGEAYESAVKEAETDAMKRALMTFGNPFGLALYDKTRANVATEPVAPASLPKRDARPIYERLSKANRALESVESFNKFWSTASVMDAVASLPVDWKKNLKAEKDDKAAELQEREALRNQDIPPEYVEPNFSNMEPAE